MGFQLQGILQKLSAEVDLFIYYYAVENRNDFFFSVLKIRREIKIWIIIILFSENSLKFPGGRFIEVKIKPVDCYYTVGISDLMSDDQINEKNFIELTAVNLNEIDLKKKSDERWVLTNYFITDKLNEPRNEKTLV